MSVIIISPEDGKKSTVSCGERRNEHSHRVSVVVKTVDKALTHVFMNKRVVRDVMTPDSKLLGGGKFAVKEEVGDFEEG